MEKELKLIKNMYINKMMTGKEIANELDYDSPQTIYNKLDKINIKRRGQRKCQKPFEIDENKLEELYLQNNLSMNDIAEKYNVSSTTIRRQLKKYKIPIKNKTWKCAGWNKGKNMSKEFRRKISKIMKQKYEEGEITHWNKGNHWDKEIREKISKTLLNGREPAPSYYGSNWQIQRTSCLQRDNYTCQQCNNKENLEVHHWTPYRFSYNNNLDNLVTLCEDCHNYMHNMYKKEGFIKNKEVIFYEL